MAEDGIELTRRAFLKGSIALFAGSALARYFHIRDGENFVAVRGKETTAEDEVDLEERIKDFALPNYGSSDKAVAVTKAEYWKDWYKQSSGFKDVVIRLQQNYATPLFNAREAVSRKMGIDINEYWIALVAGLILAESTAQDNPPEGKDIGPCQLRKEAIEDAIAILGEDYKNIDPQKPENNITLAFTYLMRINKDYPTPDLTIWSYNLGIGNMAHAIEEYGVWKLGEDQRQNLDQTLNNPKKGPASLIRSLSINALHLLESGGVHKVLSKRAPFAFENRAEEYFFKVLGGSLAFVAVADELNQTRGQSPEQLPQGPQKHE